jgi:hypothetical protein
MGSVLLSSGTKGKRSSLIHSKVMTHQVSHGTRGNIQDTRIDQMEGEKYNYILFKILAENCGKTFQEVLDFSERDRWYNSEEAKEFGLIDEVIGTNKNKSITNYFWMVGHVHLTMNVYEDIYEILASFGMNIIVAIGFWISWKDYKKEIK